jgi:hypothetical protein
MAGDRRRPRSSWERHPDPASPVRDSAQDQLYEIEDYIGNLIVGLPVVGVGEYTVSQKEVPPSVEAVFSTDKGLFGSLISTRIRDDFPKDDHPLDWIARRKKKHLPHRPQILLGFLESPAGRVFEKVVLNSKEEPDDERILMDGLCLDPAEPAIGISHFIVRGGRLLEFHLYLPNTEKLPQEDLVQYARLRCAEWRATLEIHGTTEEVDNAARFSQAAQPQENAEVEAARDAAWGFFECFHHRNLAAARRHVVTDHRVEELFRADPPDDEEKDALQWDLDNMELELTPDYEALVAASSQDMVDGSVLRFETVYGGAMLVTVRKQSGRWLIDARWWLAQRDLLRRREELAASFSDGGEPTIQSLLSDPEFAVKMFVAALITHDTDSLRQMIPSGTEMDALFPTGYQSAGPNASVYLDLLQDMPLVEVGSDELVLAPAGELTRAGAIAPGVKVMVGLHGTKELVFLLEEENGAWKVRPWDYLTQMGLC